MGKNLDNGDRVKILIDGELVDATLTHRSLQLPRGAGEAWHFTIEGGETPARDWAPAKNIEKRPE